MSENKIIKTTVVADTSSYRKGMQDAAKETDDFARKAQGAAAPARDLGTALESTAQASKEAATSTGTMNASLDGAGQKWRRVSQDVGSFVERMREAAGAQASAALGSEVLGSALNGTVEAAGLASVGLDLVATSAATVGVAMAAVLGVAALAAVTMGVAMEAATRESAAMQLALDATSNYAGQTVGSMREAAAAMAESGRVSIGTAKEVTTQLVSSGKIGQGAFDSISASAADFARVTGTEVSKVGPELVKLFEDPAKGAEQLNERMHFLTVSEIEQIKTLQEMGRMTEAQTLLSEKLNEKLATIPENLGTLEKAWRAAGNAASWAWDKMMSAGREKTTVENIQEVARDLERGNTDAYGGESGARAALDRLLKQQVAEFEKSKASAQEVEQNARNMQAQLLVRANSVSYKVSELQSKIALVKAQTVEGLDENKIKQKSEALKELNKQLDDLLNPKEKAGGGRTAKVRVDDERVLADWQRRVALLDAEAAGTEKLTATEQAYVAVLSEVTSGRLKLTTAARARFATLASEALALEQTQIQEKEAAKAAEEHAKWINALWQAEVKETARLEEGLKKEEERVAALGLTKGAVNALAAAQLEEAAAAKEVYAENLRAASAFAGEFADAYLAAADEAKRQAEILRQTAGQKLEAANKEAQIETQRGWERISDSVGQAITNALVQGGSSGIEMLKRAFKATVFQAVVQPLVSGAVSSVAGMVSGGMGAGSSGGAGLMGTASNINTLSGLAGYGAIGYQWATGSMSGANAVGTAAANATGSGLDGLIAANNGWGTMAADSAGTAGGMSGLGLAGGALGGALLGYQLGGGNALGTFAGGAGGIAAYGAGASALAGGGMAAGATAALAAVPVWGWIALAALALGGSMVTGGTPHLGGAYVAGTDGSGFKATNENYGNFGLDWGAYNSDRNAGMDGATKTLAEGIAGSLESILGKWGLENYYQVGVRFASDGEDRSPGAIRVTNLAGDTVAEVMGQFNKKAGKGLEELAGKAGEVIQQTLLSADIPAWAEDTLKALGEAPSIDALNKALGEIAQFEDAAGQITEVLGISTDAVYGLTKAFGGMSQAGAALANYYQLYYSDAERAADAQVQLNAQMEALGVTVPTSKAGFRALVESIDTTTTAGQQLYAQMVQLAGPFAQVQDAVDAVAAAAKAQADAIAAQGAGLQGRIDELMGNTAALRERELEAIDPANRALQLRIYQLQDEATAMEAARAAAVQAQEAVVGGLQGQIDALAGEFGNLVPVSRTVADALSETTGALSEMEGGLAELLGTVAKSPMDALRGTLSSRDAVGSFRASLQSSIFEARLSGADAATQAELLRGQESALWAKLQSAADPVVVAGQLQQTILKRIAAEAGAAQAATEAQAKLAAQVRSEQAETLRVQIEGMTRLRSLAADISQFVGSLDSSDLSPLAPGAQLSSARVLYEQTLAAAQSGDVVAQGQLTGNARAYLDEAKAYFASTAAYAEVYSTVRAGLSDVGAMSPTEVTVATAQAQLEALQAQGTELSTVAANSDRQVLALSELDSRMASIGDRYQSQAEQQISALKEQIEALKGVQAGQQAQIAQAAARHAELVELLRKANEALVRIQSDAALGAAA